MIVDIALSRDQDNPQLIFESMNSTGRALSQADLIRNFILMGLDTAQQTSLYREHWRPMEVAFGQEHYGKHFDRFMRHYLTLKTGELPNIQAVYEAFKGHAHSPEVAAAGVDALVADIHAYAEYYCAMALGKELDKDLAPAFQDLRELKVEVAFPCLLELYGDYAQGRLRREDFVRAVRAGRGLRVPPGSVCHSHQLAQQDLRHLRTCAPEGPLHREHPGALPHSAVLPTLSARRVDLTRFGGHLTTYTGGVHNAEKQTAIPVGVSATDRRAGPRRSQRGGAGQGVRAVVLDDPRVGETGRSR